MSFSYEKRFWEKVDKRAHGCWQWTAGKFAQGYGAFQLNGCAQRAHRIVWELTHGAIPRGKDVLHTCDNPSCVNPEHLYLGTDKENGRDRAVRGRAASGARHKSRTCPSSVPRGDNHFSRRHPEKVCRGEHHGNATLTEAQVRAILQEHTGRYGNLIELAKKYRVSRSVVDRIVRRETWKHVEV